MTLRWNLSMSLNKKDIEFQIDVLDQIISDS